MLQLFNYSSGYCKKGLTSLSTETNDGAVNAIFFFFEKAVANLQCTKDGRIVSQTAIHV
jgi:hypothetical protein